MTELMQHDGIDREAILRHLNLNPQDVNTQALLLICQRYDLDPVMKHVVLISGRPYVTRDGYLHVAHRSRQLDGIEVVETADTKDEWIAKVAVYRKDMGRPFTYVGRYPKSGQQKKYGPEMAIKTAEVMALRRAFDVTGIGAADEQWDASDVVDTTAVEAEPLADEGTHAAIRSMVANLPDDLKEQFVGWYTDQSFPPIKNADRLTQRQAEVVCDHLDELDKVALPGPVMGEQEEAEIPGSAPAPAPPDGPVVKPATNKPSAAARAALNGDPPPPDKPALGARKPVADEDVAAHFPGSEVMS